MSPYTDFDSLRIIAYSDAAFANNIDLSSQPGLIKLPMNSTNKAIQFSIKSKSPDVMHIAYCQQKLSNFLIYSMMRVKSENDWNSYLNVQSLYTYGLIPRAYSTLYPKEVAYTKSELC